MKSIVLLLALTLAGDASAACFFGVCTSYNSCVADRMDDGKPRGIARQICELKGYEDPRKARLKAEEAERKRQADLDYYQYEH